MSKQVILTGLRANTDLHIGNYLGALLPMVDMATRRAGEYQVNLFIPDLHSFTTPIEHGKLYEQVMNNLKVFVAAGLPLDHDDVHIYRQSFVPAHSELTWILDCFTGFGEMSRMTQFKDKSAQAYKPVGYVGDPPPDLEAQLNKARAETKEAQDRISVGLFNYPVLMAADILLYDAIYVPVGDDQTQHLEFTRDVAERMNTRFGNLFVVPKPVKEQHEFFGKDQGLRVRDLLDPTKKMSKSDETGKGVIFLTDSPDTARKKIMGAATDSLGDVQYDYKTRSGISNLLDLLKLFGGSPDEFIGQNQYGPLKSAVTDKVVAFLKDFQEKLAHVDEQALTQKLETSEAAMRHEANRTLARVQRAVGLRPKRAKPDHKRAGSIAKPKTVDFTDFAKLDLRIGTVEAAKAVADSDKLIELVVDFGIEKRTVVTGMREFYEPSALIGKQIPFIANLAPQTLRGTASQGMVIAVETKNGPVFLLPEQPVPAGSPLE